MKKILFTIFVSLLFLITNESFAQLPAPTLIYPSGPNIQQPITFDWTDVTGATAYRMQIWDMSQNIVVDTTNLPQSQFTLSTGILAPLTQYQWRAAAVGGYWSGFWSFTTSINPPQAPTLVYPPDDTTNMPTSFTFVWNAVPPPVSSYRLQVATDPNFSTVVVNVPGLQSTQYLVSGLLNGTVYYWHVNASNQGGTSNWSVAWNFSTIGAPPPPPSLIYPLNGATGISLTPTLDWSDVSGATDYWLQVATDPNFNTKIIDNDSLSQSQYSVPGGVFAGSTWYYWHVAAKNQVGWGSFSAYRNFLTIVGPPATPTLVAPPNGQICISRTPLLDWNNVPNVSYYNIQVSTNAGFNPTLIDANAYSSQYQLTTQLAYNTIHYWRVRACNSNGCSPFSTAWNFRTVPQIPAAPSLLAPPNASTNVTLTPTMDWTDVSGATSYRLQISSNSVFTALVLNVLVDIVSIYNVPPGILSGAQRYWWRVYSINCAGQGTASPVWYFDTKPVLAANLKVLLEGFYNPITQIQVPDTARVYLASQSPPHNFVDSAIGYLNVYGTDTVSFEIAGNGTYYIVVKHRNHLETWSSLPQAFVTGNYVNYDFTTSSSKAYGNNMKQVDGVWVLYGGDADQNGNVLIVNDYNLFKQYFGHDGYLSPDFNGNNFVDGYDLPILYSNFFKSKARP